MTEILYGALFFMLFCLLFLAYGSVIAIVSVVNLGLNGITVDKERPDVSTNLHIYLISFFSGLLAFAFMLKALHFF